MRNSEKLHLLITNFIVILLFISCHESNIQEINSLSGRTIKKSELDTFVSNQMDSLNIKGISIAVINDGEIVYHLTKGIADKYTLNPIDKNTIFETASLSKPVFACFVMKQVEKGLLDLDTPLYKYLPYPDIEYDERYKLITARMILCHITGFPNWRENDTLKIQFEPGEKFSYSGEGYEYLAKVVAHVNNLQLIALDSLFQKEIAEPLNLEHFHFGINPYIANHLASGHVGNEKVIDDSWDRQTFYAASGLYSESQNFAKLLISIMENKILKEASIDEMLRAQIELPEYNNNRRNLGNTHWALGFATRKSDFGDIYMHGGNNYGYTASFLFNRDRKFGYVFFTNSDQRNEFKKRLMRYLIQ
jgi:CubicO group peptidase (beta-lactamase class C family)